MIDYSGLKGKISLDSAIQKKLNLTSPMNNADRHLCNLVKQIDNNEPIRISDLGMFCHYFDCEPGDLVRFV